MVMGNVGHHSVTVASHAFYFIFRAAGRTCVLSPGALQLDMVYSTTGGGGGGGGG